MVLTDSCEIIYDGKEDGRVKVSIFCKDSVVQAILK